MNSKDSSSPLGVVLPALAQSVTLSPWVNEHCPAWEQLLSTHDVARLTRRPRWVLAGLVVLRRFPQKRRYHGSGVGWLRSDVIHWLSKDLRATTCHSAPAQVLRPRVARQTSLPFECTSACLTRRSRSRRRILTKSSRHE